MIGLTSLMRGLPSASPQHHDDDLEAGRGLLADEIQLGPLATPQASSRLAPELWASIFSHLNTRQDKQSLLYVCRRWRDICYEPAVFKQLFGTQVLQYVAHESLFTPRISGLLRAQSQPPHAVALPPLKQALLYDADVSLQDMAQQTRAYTKAVMQRERRPRELAALHRIHARYAEIEAARFAACTHLFFRAGQYSTLPVSVAWAIAQGTVPSLRHAMGTSVLLILASLTFGGPLIATGLSACGASVVFGIDYLAARIEHAADLFEPVADIEEPETPAFFDVIEAACRDMGDPI